MSTGFTLTKHVPSLSKEKSVLIHLRGSPQNTEPERLLEGKTKKGLGLGRKTALSGP